jgi:hypothetical protein
LWGLYCDTYHTIGKATTASLIIRSVRIRVRIHPQHPLACRKRWLNGNPWGSELEYALRIPLQVVRDKWGGHLDETRKTKVPCNEKTEVPCGRVTAGVAINISPCSKALSAEHRPKFCSPSLVIEMSPYKWKILERDVKQ